MNQDAFFVRAVTHHPANRYPIPASQRRGAARGLALDDSRFTVGMSFNPTPTNNPHATDTLSHALVDNPALAMILADKPIIFHRVYLLLMDGCREAVRDALVLAKLVEFANTLSVESGGWFPMSTAQWGEFTDLSYNHHLAARHALVKLGFLTEHVPVFAKPKVYRVESEAIHAAILNLAQTMASERQAAEAAVVRH
jgi:hypothetical protein